MFVTPDIKAEQLLFWQNQKASASMKNIQYNVYMHLDKFSGDVLFTKCSCKAGQGGCFMHSGTQQVIPPTTDGVSERPWLRGRARHS